MLTWWCRCWRGGNATAQTGGSEAASVILWKKSDGGSKLSGVPDRGRHQRQGAMRTLALRRGVSTARQIREIDVVTPLYIRPATSMGSGDAHHLLLLTRRGWVTTWFPLF